MTDEFDDLIPPDPLAGERHEQVETPPSPDDLTAIQKAGRTRLEPETSEIRADTDLPPLMRASDLMDVDEDQGDFEPGGLYKGFRILPSHLWPAESRHAHFESRFYVTTDRDTPGLVPWPGSQIVWPWEAAWEQTLYREEVESFLKEEPKKGKK